MLEPPERPGFRAFISEICLGAVVFVLAALSIQFTRGTGNLAAVWPANAVAVTWLLCAQPRRDLRLGLATFVGLVASNLAEGGDLIQSLGVSLANLIEIALCVGLTRRLISPAPDLTRADDLLRFGAIAGVAAPLASALAAASVFALTRRADFLKTVMEWYPADALGLLIVTPALLTLTRSDLSLLIKDMAGRRGLGPLVLLAVSLALVFSLPRYPLQFLVMPALLICAVRLGLPATAGASLATSAILIVATLTRHDPHLVVQTDVTGRLRLLQALLLVQTVVVLPAAAVLADRRRLEAELKASLVDAEAARAAAVEAEQLSQLASHVYGVGFWRRDFATGESVWSDEMFAIHGVERGRDQTSLPDAEALALYHPEDVPKFGEVRSRISATGEPFDLKVRLLRGGCERIVTYRGEADRGPDGEIKGMVGVMRDVTEQEAARRALAESEARYRLVTETSHDIVLQFDCQGVISFASTAVRLFGYQPEAVVGLNGFELMHPDDRPGMQQVLASLIEGSAMGRDTGVSEFRVRTAQGDYVWVEGNPGVVRDEAGLVVGFTNSLRDITKRKTAQAALAESEARYRLLADFSQDIVVNFDASGVIKYVSPAIGRYGYDPAELIGTPAANLVWPEDRDMIVARIEHDLAAGAMTQAANRTFRLLTTSGEMAWVESNPAPVVDEDGKVVGAVANLRDISDRRAAAEALADSEARYRLLAESSTDVVIKVDRDDVVQYVSPSVARYGYAPEELIGVSGFDLVHPDDREKLVAIIQDLFKTGDVDPARDRCYRLRAKGGGWAWFEGSPSVVKDEAGRPAAVISQLRDVSDRLAAERALAESEARYRLLTENATDIVSRCDLDGRFEYVSPSVKVVTGFEPAEVVGRPAIDFVHPDDRTRVELEVLESIQAPEGRQIEHRHLCKDGRTIWVQSRPRLARDPQSGRAIAITDVFRDITTRKAAEFALSESEARYRLLADNSSDVMVKVGADGVISFVTPVCERVFGFTQSEMIGAEMARFIHPDDLQPLIDTVLALAAAGPGAAPVPVQFRMGARDGRWLWFEGRPRINFSETGEYLSVQDVIRDVTDRMAMEEALAESERRHRAIAENANDLISLVDRQGRLTFISASVTDILGYAPDELIGQSLVDYAHPDDREANRALLQDLIGGRRPGGASQRYRLRHKDGRWIWLESMSTPLLNATGEVSEVIGVTRDVSAQIQIEADLRRARDEAEAAASVKSDFLANMSHEIRTPLTAILGFTNLLADQPELSPESLRQLGRISGAGQALLAIVNDVLDFSKLEAGEFVLKPRPTPIAEFMAEALALLSAQGDAKGLALKLEVGADIPDYLDLDPDRLRQVVLNLLSNAVKFTECGGVTLAFQYDQTAEHLKVQVRDTGPGLDAAQQSRLFQRFSQVDASSTRKHGGTGLGLAICRGFVDVMGGEIGVESTPGEGSCFQFHIKAPAAVAGDQVHGPRALAALAGVRVLVADDNPVNRELARAILQTLGAEVSEAEDGEAAVREAQSLPFDSILMDIRMPRLDGPAAAARIRAEPGPNQTIPILAFTADVELDLKDPNSRSDFDGVVRKPIVPLELAGAISACLGSDEAAAEEVCVPSV